jgi:enoyl-CoA hydratase
MDDSDVVFHKDRGLGHITLNRPKALNALTLGMCAAMLRQLREWADDAEVHAVVIDSHHERAFCAGGDVRWLVESAKMRDGGAAQFFATEYRLNATIKRYPKPYIALIDGFSFGGGMGISVHGSHRVVSKNALGGMPETLIGLFPDIGANHFLNRCPGELGMYLALTSARLKAADLLYTGLATHFVPVARFREIVPRLVDGEMPDAVLNSIEGDAGPAPLAGYRAAIDRAFAASSVDAILDALKGEGDWGATLAADLGKLSPTSLKVTFRAMREGKALDFASCMRMDYRVATRLAEHHDFAEGVRAAVIDKDQKPRWDPSRLDQVRDPDIARYFEPLGGGELTL